MRSSGNWSVLLIVVCGLCRIGNAYNPCCSFPCLHRGVCMTTSDEGYVCDCTNTGYGGANCEIPSWRTWIRESLRPDPETTHIILTTQDWLFDVINYVPWLKRTVMKIVYLLRAAPVDSPPLYTSAHAYVTTEAYFNRSYYARVLPPVPDECPTPLGVAGKKVLPSAQDVATRLFTRKTFIPEENGSNLLFTFFAQHFTHMFFKTDLAKGPGFTWGGHGVDVSHIYGPDKAWENQLRTFTDGKLKTRTVNGEEWPPSVDEAPVAMRYPPSIPGNQRFALGHEFFGLLPGLVMYATIWVREHNRVCDILREEHTGWTDEQLFQTARLVVLGETIKIVIEDYVQHLSLYKLDLLFDPELLFGESYQYQNRIAVEFNHLYHWHPLMPSVMKINQSQYSETEFMFNAEIPFQHGMRGMVDAFVKQPAGRVGPNNHGVTTFHVATVSIEHGRELKLQPLNEYRKRFNLKPYKSFIELTGDEDLAMELEELYGDIDGVEFFVGIMVEKHRPKALFGSSIVEMGAPFSVKGLMSNPICSPGYWKPSTFGGQRGFDIVKSATLEKLFCLNMKDCPRVAFTVPNEESQTRCTGDCHWEL